MGLVENEFNADGGCLWKEFSVELEWIGANDV